jgi:hypothetical protein
MRAAIIGIRYRLPNSVWLNEILSHLIPIPHCDVELSLALALSMLLVHVVLVGLYLFRVEHPIGYSITPNSDPDEDIAEIRFYLLKIHIERSVCWK